MPEQPIYGEHLGVVAPAEDLQIRATRQCGIHLKDQLSRAGVWTRQRFYAQVFPAAQHCRPHNVYHPSIFSHLERARGQPTDGSVGTRSGTLSSKRD